MVTFMKKNIVKTLYLIVLTILLFSFQNYCYYYNSYPYVYSDYPYVYSGYPYVYSGYPYGYSGDNNGIYGHSQDGVFLIPYNAYYYITGYDREARTYMNGQPLVSRVPVFGGNYSYPTTVANRLIYNAYLSMSNWCNNYVFEENNYEGFYLNFANIQSETATQIILNVYCALNRNNNINNSIQFVVTLNIPGNSFIWRKLSSKNSSLKDGLGIYEYDSLTGQIRFIS